MVCEFLPPDFKKKLVEIATINDLMNAGYSKMGAYKAKEKGVMSDEKCEKLVDLLGDRAWGLRGWKSPSVGMDSPLRNLFMLTI